MIMIKAVTVTRDNDYDIVSVLRAYFLIINDTDRLCVWVLEMN